jgi:surface protein
MSNVTTLDDMFERSQFNGDIRGTLPSMMDMFNASQFNSDIYNWNTGNVASMEKVFGDGSFRNISRWSVSKSNRQCLSSPFKGRLVQLGCIEM